MQLLRTNRECSDQIALTPTLGAVAQPSREVKVKQQHKDEPYLKPNSDILVSHPLGFWRKRSISTLRRSTTQLRSKMTISESFAAVEGP
ncbi:unnamed protein product [Caenorhabditis bovis]|uniref:Uncharacterized protein n=1 Tax=Caenorhabditis bovis TaxID=2654633 RepID=A0A8S1EAX0_9PELO|nr:unnamed protein product [Caenorhabditis bovis]